jgi:SAM (Sterile alpha motif) domain-containing protein
MQSLAHWLEKLGMSEYARRFAGNGISAAALHLTDQDLKDIGACGVCHGVALLRGFVTRA